MSEQFPFQNFAGEKLDIEAIFGGAAPDGGGNPFPATPQTEVAPQVEVTDQPPTVPQPTQPTEAIPAQEQTPPSMPPAESAPPVTQPVTAEQPIPTASMPTAESPLQMAFENQIMENTKKGLFEKPPVFSFKGNKEDIEDASLTFEELRIQKADTYLDLDEGKCVSWSVDYCGIRKDIKDPKGTTIASMKEMIEQSPEFLSALKNAKGKNPDCLVKPKVSEKRKGVLPPLKGHFATVDAARNSDKRICLIPSSDGRLYELRKTEIGEFVAPKNKVTDFQAVRAGFVPALPLIPMTLIRQIISFFRSVMGEKDYEAFAMIYWDKLEQRFFAYVPKQIVAKEDVVADLSDCPYDDETRYIQYADIHSHNSMRAFFSAEDDRDERGTGLYFVVGRLNHFLPDIKARISCNGSFVLIDPHQVIEGLEHNYPAEWNACVTIKKDKKDKVPPAEVSLEPPGETVIAA